MPDDGIARRLDRIDAQMEAGRREFRDFLAARDERIEKQIAADRRAIAELEVATATTGEFVREMIVRMDRAGQRQDALFEHLIGRVDAGTEAIMRMLDRLGDGPRPAS